MEEQFVEQNKQENGKKINFDKFMFGDFGLRRLAPVITEIESENTQEESPSEPSKPSIPQKLKRKNTVSGKFIISRYWDDNNMCEFWVRRINS